MNERAMTPTERQEWRVRDDQCATWVTERAPLDSACLMPMPCVKHAAPVCSGCGKRVWPVIHSCKRVRQSDA